MLLIASNTADLATDFFVLRLRERGLPFVRLNTDEFGAQWDVDFRIGSQCTDFQIRRLHGEPLSLAEITSAYVRQPRLPELDHVIEADRSFAEREIGETMKSIWRLIDDDLWLNPPHRILRSSNKPEQLDRARRIGFRIPETCITSDARTVRQFADAHDGHVIAKAVKHGFCYEMGNARVASTQALDQDTLEHLDDYAPIPMIVQRRLPKACDVRVTVVGDDVFAVAIYSQEHPETAIDWRMWDLHDVNLKHERFQLPKEVAGYCRDVTAHFGLRYAAIDLVLSPEDGFYFLELNPNGQWAWLEQLTQCPIRDSLIKHLGLSG